MTKTEIEKPPSEDARERARAVVAELSGEDIYTNMVEDALAAAITAAELRGMRRADAAIGALRGLEAFFEREGEDSLERFERIADEFRRDTGFLRPGKDCVRHDPEVRQAAYDKWVAGRLAAAREAIRAEAGKC